MKCTTYFSLTNRFLGFRFTFSIFFLNGSDIITFRDIIFDFKQTIHVIQGIHATISFVSIGLDQLLIFIITNLTRR
ncbi:Uncharacterised protein [Mycobacterium tuberculosis]|nr:Uncharacterised protein [Mycobacterium tuberculosis]